MQIPSWFQSAIQERVNNVMAQIERQPELRKLRAEEHAALDAMFPGVNKAQVAEFLDWEDKLHCRRAAENEGLYLQGVKDGMRLAVALLSDDRGAS